MLMRGRAAARRAAFVVCVALAASLALPPRSDGATAQAIDAGADKALDQFRNQVQGADAFLRDAKGVLMFPEVIQAGIGIGGQYGEGVLRVGGQSAAYYSFAAGSFGFQFGAQRKSIIVAFLQPEALQSFRDKARADKAWNVGVDGSVALLNLGAQASIDSATVNQPIVAFVFAQSGLMYNLSLQGAKITKLDR